MTVIQILIPQPAISYGTHTMSILRGEEMGDAAGDYLILTVIAGLNVRLGKNPYLAAWKTVVA